MYVMTLEQHVFGRGNSSAHGVLSPVCGHLLNARTSCQRPLHSARSWSPAMARHPGEPGHAQWVPIAAGGRAASGRPSGAGRALLFMYKDPRAGGSGPAHHRGSPHARATLAAPAGPSLAAQRSGLQERGEALAAYLDGRELVALSDPRAEEALLGEIVRTASRLPGTCHPWTRHAAGALCAAFSSGAGAGPPATPAVSPGPSYQGDCLGELPQPPSRILLRPEIPAQPPLAIST